MPGDPSEVRVVQFIFDAYANRDMSLRDIGRELERQGVLTPAGNRVWSRNCVGRILRDEVRRLLRLQPRPAGQDYRLGTEGADRRPGSRPKLA